jgi:hypothetical protein
MGQDFILDREGYIVDPETCKNAAVIRNGEIFRTDKDGTRIAVFVGSNLYDLVLLCHKLFGG